MQDKRTTIIIIIKGKKERRAIEGREGTRVKLPFSPTGIRLSYSYLCKKIKQGREGRVPD